MEVATGLRRPHRRRCSCAGRQTGGFEQSGNPCSGRGLAPRHGLLHSAALLQRTWRGEQGSLQERLSSSLWTKWRAKLHCDCHPVVPQAACHDSSHYSNLITGHPAVSSEENPPEETQIQSAPNYSCKCSGPGTETSQGQATQKHPYAATSTFVLTSE